MGLWATVEFLPGQRAAIIELTDSRGDWTGGFRIDIRSPLRSDLYEEGYRAASSAAAVKGGTLDRFCEYQGPSVPARPAGDPDACGQLVSADFLRRPANALNVEVMQPMPRCRRKMPEHWSGTGTSSLRWLASGGSPLVFGRCTPANCPQRR